MHRTYGRVLRRPRVLAMLVPYVMARLPQSMMTLALLLMVRAQTGSFSRAGTVAAAFGVAGAVGTPALARVVDRRGALPVLLAAGPVHAAALTAAALTGHDHPLLCCAGAAVGGLTVPPLSGCMRAMWTRLLDDEAERTAAFALDGILIEVAELVAPLAVGGAAALGRPQLAVVAGACLTAVAALAFGLAVRSGDDEPAAEVPSGSAAGALANRGVRRILFLVLLLTWTVGSVEVLVAGYARRLGSDAAAGPLIAVTCIGGIVAGAAYGRWRAPWPARRLLPAVLGAVAAAAVGVGSAHARPLVLAALVTYGAAVAVAVIALTGEIAVAADEHVRTESFAWASTANFVGVGIGTCVTGLSLDRLGLHTSALLAAAPVALAATVAALRAVARRSDEVAPAGPTVDELEARVHDLEQELAATRAALESALAQPPHLVLLRSAEERAAAMLQRADAECAAARDRADDDAARVREVATQAAIEILRAAERDATAILERARRIAAAGDRSAADRALSA